MQAMQRWWTNLSRRIRPRSNGVPVRPGTAVHIRSADIARAQQDWISAAASYRLALAREPHLHHLWVQLGHMEKEAGAIDRAAAAYGEAARLQPEDAEPLRHLGHMAKAWGQPADAAAYFIQALKRDSDDLKSIAELARLMPDYSDANPEFWSAALDALGLNPAAQIADDAGSLPPRSILFDVTDLLAFFGYRRLPTGIQRVQIEISLALLADGYDVQPIFCLYASARRGWIRLHHDMFEALCRLAKQSDDVKELAWMNQLAQIYRTIAISRTMMFAPRTVLVNLGTSWSDRNYLLDIRTARVRDNIVYVPLVFDLIPLIGPDWFSGSLVRDYRAWFTSLLHSADGCVAISQATRHDLIEKSGQWNAPFPADAVPVVRLDGDFRHNTAIASIVQDHDLRSSGYVLLVSTLEPRKNHLGAFHAWLRLADVLGEDALPLLVCVGGRGWLNDDLHRMMRDQPRLKRMVRILHGVPDDELATLYEHCLFALYPSFYEGWGLPVSEALSYGKVPAVSNTSSLPEAGGSHAHYFDPHDADAIAATVRMLLDNDVRSAAEAAIRHDHTPRTWWQIAQDLVAKAQMVTPRVKDTLPRLTGTGSWSLAICRYSDEDTMTGEALRHGRGWLAPTMTGCKIYGNDAALWFYWSGMEGALFHVHIAKDCDAAPIHVSVNGIHQVTHDADEERVAIIFPLPAVPGPVLVDLKPMAKAVIVEKVTIVLRDQHDAPSVSEPAAA